MPGVHPRTILFDARTVRPGMTGVGRYAYNLLAAMARQPGRPPLRALFLKDSLTLARRDPALAGVELIEAPVSHESHPRGDWWLQHGLSRLLDPDDLYHGPAFMIPAGRRPFARTVTIHDLFVFTHAWAYPWKFALWLRWTIRRSCRWADRIIVPSQAVADQIAERGLAAAEKTVTIPYAPDATPELWETPAPDAPGDETLLRSMHGRAHLVTIGTLDPRKDPLTARKALIEWHRSRPQGLPEDFRWLWIGGAGSLPDPTPPELARQAETLGFRALGARPGVMARRALEKATALVTCSHAEGFGLPLAEALAAGCPIIASDLPVHREVAGDAALYFPVGEARALALAIEALVGDPALQSTLRDRALRRAGQFDWNAIAGRTLSLCDQAATRT